MNRLISGLLLVALSGFPIVQGRTLSPGARLMVEQHAAGDSLVKFDSGSRRAVAVNPKTVGAYIILDDEAAISSLEDLGVRLHHNHGRYYTASIPVNMLAAAGEVSGVKYISTGNHVSLLNDYNRRVSGADVVHSNDGDILPRPFTGKGVVVGMIDIGIEYDHPAYRDQDGNTRIKAVWNQRSYYGSAPEEYGYGVEYTTPEAIREATFDTSSEYHGGHTTGTAAGGDRSKLLAGSRTLSPCYGVAPDADIVFVSLDQENSTAIPDAIKYIFDYADEVNKPCVINMSLGEHIGPHNGTSLLDQTIDAMVGPGRIIVGACGNEGAVRLHASEMFTAADKTLKSMLTKSETSNHDMHYLDIWSSDATDFKVKICVVNSLKGNIVASTPEADTSVDGDIVIHSFELDECGATATVMISAERSPINGQTHVEVRSSVNEINTGRVMGVVVEGEEGQTIHMWNYGLNEFSSNGKSGWTDGDTEFTVGEIGGTAKRIIAVGAYDARPRVDFSNGQYALPSENQDYEEGHHSYFSSYGPTADGRTVPHILAGGNPVISAFNKYFLTSMGATTEQLLYNTNGYVKNDGISYYYIYNTGTSMAAPFVAGTIALMLEANPELTPEQARDIIMSSAAQEDFMGTLPNNTYGAGAINTLGAVKETVAMSGVESMVTDAVDDTRVWAEGSTVYVAVKGAVVNAMANVYNTAGVLVGSYPLQSGLSLIDASSWGRGVFIVNIDGKGMKVAL